MNRVRTALAATIVAFALAACTERTAQPRADSTATGMLAMPGNAIDLVRAAADVFDLFAGPDGRITYSRVVNGYAAIFVADSNGGNPRRITDGVWDFSPRFSPDGKWIAFGRETNGFDILVVSADSGEARPLAESGAREEVIGWLPDGSGVLYTKITGSRLEIWVATMAGKQSPLIARDGGVYGNVSPDGKWLAYHLIEKGKRTLWLYDFSTTKSRQLTTEGYETIGQALGIWSPDSKRVLYASARSGTSDVWSIDVTTGATRQLTTDVRDDDRPRFSPDGSRVAFMSTRGGQVDAWVVSDTGGDALRVTDNRAIEGAPEWTRDGKSLLVETNGGESHAFIAPISGGAPRRLVSGDNQQVELSIAGDGKHAAVALFDGSQTDIAVVPIEGGAPTVVADGPSQENMPAMSPDGQHVAFISNRAGNQDLYVVPASGGQPTRLTDWSSDERTPRWSPDGQWIAFNSGHESPFDVWLVKADGTGMRRLTKLGGVGDHHWSNDGRFLVVYAATSRGASVYTVSVADGSLRTIADGAYGSSSYAPGDSLVILTDFTGGFARQELRRLDGTLARALSPRDGLVYESEGYISPDGTMRAFSRFTFKDNDYLPTVEPIAGGASTRLFEGRGNTQEIEWLPDSKSIAYVFVGADRRIFRVPMK